MDQNHFNSDIEYVYAELQLERQVGHPVANPHSTSCGMCEYEFNWSNPRKNDQPRQTAGIEPPTPASDSIATIPGRVTNLDRQRELNH